jgi:2-succinyl-5-enolpyruvyl-6-hydroxy-3-cyclohexene-1-carboxylate synthase
MGKHDFKTTPNKFFKNFLKLEQNKNTYLCDWKEVRQHRLKQHYNYEKKAEYSDFKVFSHIFRTLPKQINLQLSNSATIRYAQLFEIHSSVNVFCNRGTSGIDGSTSTAIGAAFASKLQTVFVSGDLGFLYDSNALWNNYIPNNFRLIVINNKGGGIFRILPGAKETDHFNKYFETQHDLSVKPLCEMFNIEYSSASNLSSLDEQLEIFYQSSDRPKLLEVFTPSEINDKVLLGYFKYLK